MTKVVTSMMLIVTVVSSCGKMGDARYEAVNDLYAGTYVISEIYHQDKEILCWDLNGDGIASDELLEEFYALPSYNFGENIYSKVKPAMKSARKWVGKIVVKLPIQGIHSVSDGYLPGLGGVAYIETPYIIDSEFNIVPEPVKDLGVNPDSGAVFEYQTISDVIISFPESGQMRMEVTTALYDYTTEIAKPVRIDVRFNRINI